MKKLLSLLSFFVLVGSCGLSGNIGCSTMPVVVSGISLASNIIPVIDSFYDQVLAAKANPDKLQAATLILQQADAIAKAVNQGIASQAEATKLADQAKVLQAQAEKLGG